MRSRGPIAPDRGDSRNEGRGVSGAHQRGADEDGLRDEDLVVARQRVQLADATRIDLAWPAQDLPPDRLDRLLGELTDRKGELLPFAWDAELRQAFTRSTITSAASRSSNVSRRRTSRTRPSFTTTTAGRSAML